MMTVHHKHMQQHLAILCSDFDSSTYCKLASSILQHITQNPSMCVGTTLLTYGLSIGLQVGNEALGYVMAGNNNVGNVTYTTTVSSAATGVSYTYPIIFFFHYTATKVYASLDQQDQNTLKNLFAIAHDCVSSVAYFKIGTSISKADMSFIVNIGAPVLSALVIFAVFIAEKYKGGPVIVPRQVYQDAQAAIQCCKKDESEAELILHAREAGIGSFNSAPGTTSGIELTAEDPAKNAASSTANNTASRAVVTV